MDKPFTLYPGDCLESLKKLPDNSVDAIVTDPPYGLSFMGKRWDYDVPGTEVWAECLRVLKPGGHLPKPAPAEDAGEPPQRSLFDAA